MSEPALSATYELLGRFVIGFATLCHHLDETTISVMRLSPTQQKLVAASLANRHANEILSTFMSVVHLKFGDNLADADRAILKAFAKEVKELIEVRNRLMHDTWMVRYPDPEAGDPGGFSQTRRVPHSSGVRWDRPERSFEQLMAIQFTVQRLCEVSFHIMYQSRPWLHADQQQLDLASRMELINGKVHRRASPAL